MFAGGREIKMTNPHLSQKESEQLLSKMKSQQKAELTQKNKDTSEQLKELKLTAPKGWELDMRRDGALLFL